MQDIFNSTDLGEGYAQWRPAVHPHVVERIVRRVGPVSRALDIGCGTGLSTRALRPLAGDVTGMEPYVAMLRWSRSIAPEASFVAGAAEELAPGVLRGCGPVQAAHALVDEVADAALFASVQPEAVLVSQVSSSNRLAP